MEDRNKSFYEARSHSQIVCDTTLVREIEQVNALKLGIIFRRAHSSGAVADTERCATDIVRSVLSFDDMAWETADFLIETYWQSGIEELADLYSANLHEAYDNDVYQVQTEDLFATFVHNYIMQHRGGNLEGVAPELSSKFEELMAALSPELICKLRLLQGIKVPAVEVASHEAS